MSNIFIAAIALSLVAILAWNFIPGIRERLRGWTTMLDAGVLAALPHIGNAIDAFEGTDWRSFFPQDAWPYVTAGIALWFIFKRVITTTPIGEG